MKNGLAETYLDDGLQPDLRGSALMRAVNKSMCALSAGLDESESIAFFCECELAGCFAICWMTRSELSARLDDGGWILSDGHRGSNPWSDHSPVIQERPRPLDRSGVPIGKDRSLSGVAAS